MKKILALLTSALMLVSCLASCGETETPETNLTTAALDQREEVEGIWKDAKYIEDTTLGEGANTFKLEVSAIGKTVTFTVNTDKTVVGEALEDEFLISGEEGAYGLYVKYVNGMFADYDTDTSYWSFYINGEYAMSGVDTTEIKEGEVYKLEYVKE